MEYGVIYIKICPKEGTPGEWIKYCQILSATPKSFQQNAEDIANTAVFLLSDKSSWMTGQIIGVDGGLSTLNVN